VDREVEWQEEGGRAVGKEVTVRQEGEENRACKKRWRVREGIS
jgi:hypothetical protein